MTTSLLEIHPTELMTVPVIKVGGYTITHSGTEGGVRGTTIKGFDSIARRVLFDVTNPTINLQMTVQDSHWANGERDIVAIERHETPERFDGLKNRLRIGINRCADGHDGWFIELRQAQLNEPDRPKCKQADLRALTSGAGVDVADALLTCGADIVGPRSELYGTEGPRKNIVAAHCNESPELVPVVAYVLTRIAPIANGVRA